MQAYAERAKKVNEDKEKEEARREAERLRFWFFLMNWKFKKSGVLKSSYELWSEGMRRRRKETPHPLWQAQDQFRMAGAQLAQWAGTNLVLKWLNQTWKIELRRPATSVGGWEWTCLRSIFGVN